jgi:hypothetical protein
MALQDLPAKQGRTPPSSHFSVSALGNFDGRSLHLLSVTSGGPAGEH